jgi:hypothetical protein
MATRFLERGADQSIPVGDSGANVAPTFVDSDVEKLKVYDRTNSEWKTYTPDPNGAEYATVTQITSAATGVTVAGLGGAITTVALTTAAAAEEVFEVTNTKVVATDVIALSTTYAGGGTPILSVKGVGAGVFTIVISNVHATAALDAVMVINFRVLKQAE